MRKIYLFIFFTLSTLHLVLVTSVHAVCPVCTVAVGAGLGLTRYLGIDDTVSGVWIGGLVLSSSFWLSDWLKKKNFSFLGLLTPHLSLLTLLLVSASVFLPLYFSKIIGHPFNKILGLDKLVFGSLAGALVFALAVVLDKMVRQAKGHQLFIYQKVVFPVVSLLCLSLIFYLTIHK